MKALLKMARALARYPHFPSQKTPLLEGLASILCRFRMRRVMDARKTRSTKARELLMIEKKAVVEAT